MSSQESEEFDNGDVRYLENSVFEVGYLNTLNNATETLSANDAPFYFRYTLNHFSEGDFIDNKTATTVLQSIRKLIKKKQIYDAFKVEGFYDLPYGSYSKELYPLIYDLLQNHPDIFAQQDDRIEKNLLKSFIDDPKKGLSIIATAAQKYAKNDSLYLWPILDLTKEDKAVSCIKDNPELLSNYLSIVVYLCQSSNEFRENRLVGLFSLICQNILSKNTDKQLLRQIYITLCYLRDEAKRFSKKKQGQLSLPIDKMISHLSVENAQGPILALLVDRAGLNPDELDNQKLINKLFNVAEKNSNLKATIVLMRLASSLELAKKVFGDGEWLLKELPDTVDTIRLFLVIFEHTDLRPEIARNENFIPFLKTIIQKLKSSGVITIVCTVIRRLDKKILNQKFVKSMSEQGLVDTFIQTAKNTDDETKVSSHSLLLFLNTLAGSTYLEEYINMCSYIADKTKKDQSLCEIASYVAVTFAQYDKCRQKFVELHLDDFFRKKKDDRKSKRLAKNAEKFLSNIDNQ